MSYFRIGLSFLLLLSCNLSQGKINDEVLLVVHDREITTEEFLYYFQKEDQELTDQNLEEFLASFIIFQLKLAQAREERLQNNMAFRNELIEYRLLIAAPYLTDKETEGDLVVRLKKEWNFKENPESLEIIYDLVDERVFRGNWIPPAGQSLNQPLFYIDGKKVYQKDFIEYLSEQETSSGNPTISEYIFSMYLQFVSARLIKYENYKLEEKFPEFRLQMQEYRDAMLLLAITKKMVWSKAETDPQEPSHQEYLMKNWIEELRSTYEVQINKKVLLSIK